MKRTRKILPSSEDDLQQSTPALQGEAWVPQSDVKPKRLSHQMDIGTGFRDLWDCSCFSFKGERGASQARLTCWQKTKSMSAGPTIIPSRDFCSDLLLCTGKHVAYSSCSSLPLANEGQWHLVWNKVSQRVAFLFLSSCLGEWWCYTNALHAHKYVEQNVINFKIGFDSKFLISFSFQHIWHSDQKFLLLDFE